MFFNLVHISVFAVNGEGINAMQIIGNFLDMCAQCTVMLEILYVAKGWTITNPVLSRRVILYSVWAVYSAVYTILFAFTIVSCTVSSNELHTYGSENV